MSPSQCVKTGSSKHPEKENPNLKGFAIFQFCSNFSLSIFQLFWNIFCHFWTFGSIFLQFWNLFLPFSTFLKYCLPHFNFSACECWCICWQQCQALEHSKQANVCHSTVLQYGASVRWHWHRFSYKSYIKSNTCCQVYAITLHAVALLLAWGAILQKGKKCA